MSLADEDRKRDEFSHGNIMKYENYKLSAPGGDDDDYCYDAEDDEEEAKKPATADTVDKLYTTTALREEVDAIMGVMHDEYAVLDRVTSKSEHLSEASEIAIIGFWKLKETGVFRCVHSFEIPNPMKREVNDVEATSIYQVLYEGKNGELFFFYLDKDPKEPESAELCFAILDTKSDQEKKHQISLKSAEGGSNL